MNILAFESSCDETAVAVVRDGRTVLSDAILSQADMHALYGGVVPEIASRKHVEAIAGLTDQALADAGLTKSDVDAVAVTYAPGVSLWVRPDGPCPADRWSESERRRCFGQNAGASPAGAAERWRYGSPTRRPAAVPSIARRQSE